MPPLLGIDFETYSGADLKVAGTAAYAAHPSTDVHCAAYEFDDGAGGVWCPGQPIPERVCRHLTTGGEVLAHNATFEAAILQHVLGPHHGWPVPTAEQWQDSAVVAAACNLPTTLEGLCKALGTNAVKDTEGRELMLSASRSVYRDGEWHAPFLRYEQVERLLRYCAADVRAMMECWAKLPALPATERALVVEDRKINARGVCVDQQFAAAMRRVVVLRERQLDAEAARITGDVDFRATSAPAIRQFVADAAHALPVVARKRKGGAVVKTPTVGKEAVAALLRDPTLDDAARRVLSLRAEAAKTTSLAKLQRIPHMASADGRLRHALAMYGAITGRWASRGLQVHNLPKTDKALKPHVDALRAAITAGDIRRLVELTPTHMTPLQVLSHLLRTLIVAAPGMELLGADYSAIEARVCAWLAGQHDKVEVFRRYDATAGLSDTERRPHDPYVIAAAKIGSADRQLGKVQELALQYGMGDVKFAATAAGYGIPLDVRRAREVKTLWREHNPAIVRLWSALEDGAMDAMRNPARTVRVGEHLAWRMRGSCLCLRLPSGRDLRYWRPRVRTVTRRFESVDDAGNVVEREVERPELQFFTESADRRGMAVEGTYGGKLAENATQAVAREVLAAALLRLRGTPYPVVLHVHDSVVAEIPEGTGVQAEFCELLARRPDWARTLPLAVEGYRSVYFRG